jgi:hypothetical protein
VNTLSAAVNNVLLESGPLFQGEYSDSGFWEAVPQGQGMVAGNGWVAACGRRNSLYVNLRVELRAGKGAHAPEQDGQATEAPLELGRCSCPPTLGWPGSNLAGGTGPVPGCDDQRAGARGLRVGRVRVVARDHHRTQRLAARTPGTPFSRSARGRPCLP